MQSVVDKLMMELYEDGMILILPTATVQQIPGVHFSQSHWALKKGKAGLGKTNWRRVSSLGRHWSGVELSCGR